MPKNKKYVTLYHPANQCYLIYSKDNKLSAKSNYEALSASEVTKRFGLTQYVCDDLKKSVEEANSYSESTGITKLVPISLFEGENPITKLITQTSTLNLFILHKISSKSGYGISTYSALTKGSIIAEYVGERKSGYQHIEDKTYVVLNHQADGTNIDAKYFGNVARFFNHCPLESSNPNVLTANIEITSWKVSDQLSKVIFITNREIKAFEPLCWDYGSKYTFEDGVELLDNRTYLPLSNDSSQPPVGLAEFLETHIKDFL